MISKPRGGTRLGAGRPTKDGVIGTKRYCVLLDSASNAEALRLGKGSRSEGIRRSLKINRKLSDER